MAPSHRSTRAWSRRLAQCACCRKKMCEPKGILVERTERERQSNLGKILDELAERHITQEQLKNAHAGDLERDRFDAPQMRDNASSENHVVSQVVSAADVERGFFGVITSARCVVYRPSSASGGFCCVLFAKRRLHNITLFFFELISTLHT